MLLPLNASDLISPSQQAEGLWVNNIYLITEWSAPRVTMVASVAWRDISLASASDVLLYENNGDKCMRMRSKKYITSLNLCLTF